MYVINPCSALMLVESKLTFEIDYRSQTGRESQLWLVSKIEEVRF